MNKKELREKYKILRKQLSLEQMESYNLAIANNVLQMPIWKKTYFHIFLSIEHQKEVSTDEVLHILSGRDKEIVVSKSDFDTFEMTHYLLTDNTKFRKNEYNIPEPIDGIEVPVSKMDVVFVPLLAFDIKGNRVGYGKGFYDRFLSNCKPDVIKIGLSFFDAETAIEDASNNDILLDYCVTPNQIYHF